MYVFILRFVITIITINTLQFVIYIYIYIDVTIEWKKRDFILKFQRKFNLIVGRKMIRK